MFTHPRMLGDGPGPAAYKPLPVLPNKGSSFVPHPSADVRTTALPRPGPGSYNVPQRASNTGGPAISFGAALGKKNLKPAPGPGSYNPMTAVSKGGKISRHRVRSDVEMAMERARHQPGPGEYELHSLSKGKSSTISGRTRAPSDLLLMQSSRRPGPGTYEVVPGRVRGGVMAVNPRRNTSLPALAPGPGSYNPTMTLRQEKEMRKLSKQVVQLAQNRHVLTQSRSAPEGLGVSRRRARTQGGLTKGFDMDDLARRQRPSFRAGLASATILE